MTTDTEVQKPPPDPPPARDERGGTLSMSLGLGALGFAAGFVTGLSVHEGISSTLLSSIFSFVGGTLLSFSGFAYVLRGSGKRFVSTRRMGLGVFAFALGATLGPPAGITARVVGDQWSRRCLPASGWLTACDANLATARRKAGSEEAQVRRQADAEQQKALHARDLETLLARAEVERRARELAKAIDAQGKVRGRDTVAILTEEEGARATEPGAPGEAAAESGPRTSVQPAALAVTEAASRAGEWAAQSSRAPLCEAVLMYLGTAPNDSETALGFLRTLCDPAYLRKPCDPAYRRELCK
jgi:hypothetical protein